MVKKKGVVKVKSYHKVGDTFLDKFNYNVAGIKSKKVKAHTRKPPKRKK